MSEVVDYPPQDLLSELEKTLPFSLEKIEKTVGPIISSGNFKISDNDRVNETIINNLKEYIFRKDKEVPFISLGQIMPKLLDDFKKIPEYSIFSEFLNDLRNNTLLDNLNNYISDENVVDELRNYNNKIKSDFNKGATEKSELSVRMKGGEKLNELIPTIGDYTYYTILSSYDINVLTSKQFLLYFEFNFQIGDDQGKNNNSELQKINTEIKLLNEKALSITESFIKKINDIKSENSIEKAKTSAFEQVNKLKEQLNNLIILQGKISIIYYDPLTHMVQFVGGPYECSLNYNFTEKKVITINLINSINQAYFNKLLYLLNKIMFYTPGGTSRASLSVVEDSYLAGGTPDEDTNSEQKGLISNEINEQLQNQTNLVPIQTPINQDNNEDLETFTTRINSMLSSNKDKFEEIMNLILTKASKLDNTPKDLLWIQLDKVISNISNIFTKETLYFTPKFGLSEFVKSGKYITVKPNNNSLDNLSNSIAESIDYSLGTNFAGQSIFDQFSPEKIEIFENQLEIVKTDVNLKISTLEGFIDLHKNLVTEYKEKFLLQFQLIIFVIMAIILFINSKKIISFAKNIILTIVAQATIKELFGSFIQRNLGVDLNIGEHYSKFIPLVHLMVPFILAGILVVSESFKEFIWQFYYNLLIPLFKKLGLNQLIITELNISKFNDDIEYLRNILESGNKEQIENVLKYIGTSNSANSISYQINLLKEKGGSKYNKTKKIKKNKNKNKKSKRKPLNNKVKTKNMKKKNNKTKKYKMKGGSNASDFINHQYIIAILDIYSIFLFPEKNYISNTSLLIDEIYSIICNVKIPLSIN